MGKKMSKTQTDKNNDFIDKSESQIITVSMPKALLSELDAIVSARQRSHFINEAVSKQIAIVKQTQGIEESAGIWTDEHHPDMQDDKAIDQWLEDTRQDWR